jgi:Protein of unknown function (DUF4031)
MSVYVDDMDAPFQGTIMCHMLADTHEELMAMAKLLRLNPAWIQHPGTPKEHFDISLGKKRLALAHGALPITWDEAGAFVVRKRLTRASGPYVAAPPGTTPAPGATMHPHVIVCTRNGGGARKCTSCQAFRHDIRLCDWPLHGAKSGETCSRVVCTRCAVHVEPDLDYCAAHGRVLAAQGKEADAPNEPQRTRTPGESADPSSDRVQHQR